MPDAPPPVAALVAPEPMWTQAEAERMTHAELRAAVDAKIAWAAAEIQRLAAALQSSEARREEAETQLKWWQEQSVSWMDAYDEMAPRFEKESDDHYETKRQLAAMQSRLAAAEGGSAKAMRERFEAKWGRIRSLACEQITTEGNLRLSRLDGEELWALAAPPSAPGAATREGNDDGK